MGIEFYQTHMGHKFFEADVPALIKAVNRCAEAIEKHNEIAQKLLEARVSEDTDK